MKKIAKLTEMIDNTYKKMEEEKWNKMEAVKKESKAGNEASWAKEELSNVQSALEEKKMQNELLIWEKELL